jgi:hypothetical protein
MSVYYEHLKDGKPRHYIDFIEKKKLSVEYIDIMGKPVVFDPSDLVTRNEVVRVRNYDLMNILEIRVGGNVIRPG